VTDDYYGDDYAEDPNEAWNASFESDPAATAYRLAQIAAAEAAQNQAGFDLQQASVNAAAILQIAQEQQAAEQAGQGLARTIDSSMSGEYKGEWTALSSKVANRLSTDEGFLRLSPDDPRAALDAVDRVFQQVRADSDPNRSEWDAVKAAGENDYAIRMARQEIINEVQGR
jgi:hypothetical protein